MCLSRTSLNLVSLANHGLTPISLTPVDLARQCLRVFIIGLDRIGRIVIDPTRRGLTRTCLARICLTRTGLILVRLAHHGLSRIGITPVGLARQCLRVLK